MLHRGRDGALSGHRSPLLKISNVAVRPRGSPFSVGYGLAQEVDVLARLVLEKHKKEVRMAIRDALYGRHLS